MPAKERPRNWHVLDLDFFVQDTIEALRDPFGFDGPGVFLILLAEAHKPAHAGPRAQQGTVELRWAALAQRARLERARVQAIVRQCEAVGLLDLDGTDETRLVARFLKWSKRSGRSATWATPRTSAAPESGAGRASLRADTSGEENRTEKSRGLWPPPNGGRPQAVPEQPNR
jgi:hypothetical protein